ncbi:MAG: alcohol dehydrogenase catalytic domain-containing protein, partial [Candidatus Aminicenantes bacterium]|nr:alcohol dehydrogenase catalytic domain-containing protein [Candidatus Aminicenantes bacterium]
MKASYYEGNRTFGVRESAIQKPGRGEVRLKIFYCGVCGTDVHIFQGHMDSRVKIPQVIGHEMSGEIVELGEGV